MHAPGNTTEGVVLLVADSGIRPYLRRLVMLEFPKLHVLSRQEMPAGMRIDIVGEFGADAQAP